MFSILAIGIAENATTTTTGVRYVLNDTNLAPSVVGEIYGTGERIADNRTYWSNNSSMYISLYAHANTTGDNSEIHLYINGTKYQDQSGKPIGIAEQNNKSIFHIIPQNSYYSVEVLNAHHYVWMETQILTGNVTTTTGGSGIGGSCIGCINLTQLEDNMSLKVNKSGDTMAGYLIVDGYGLSTSGSYIFMDSSPLNLIRMRVYGTNSNYIEMFENSTVLTFSNATSRSYNFTENGLNMSGGYINNSPSIDAKVNKSGDNMTGVLGSNSNITTSSKIFVTDGINGKQIDTSISSISDTIRTEKNGAQVWRMLSSTDAFSNNFGAGVSRGNLTNPTATLNGDRLFSFFANGYDGTTYSAKNSRLNFYAKGNFNATYHPTSVELWTTDTADNLRAVLIANTTGDIEAPTGTLISSDLTGAGNAYVCVDVNGKLYRGSPTC